MRRGAAGLLFLALVVAADPASAARTTVHRPAEFAVGTTSLRYDQQGTPLEVTVYYPARGRATPLDVEGARRETRWAPFPMILFSLDYGATPGNYAALLHAWASHGYIVAIPTYPPPEATEGSDASGNAVVDLGGRVVDASFVIDRMLDRAGGGFGGVINRRRIVAAGHALGAITTFALAYNTRARDPRISAAMTLAGSVAGDTANYFTGVDTPLLVIHGDNDSTYPIADTQQAFALANPPKFFVTLLDSDHATPFVTRSDPGFNVVQNTTLDFLSAYVGGRPSGLQQLERDGKVKSLATIASNPE